MFHYWTHANRYRVTFFSTAVLIFLLFQLIQKFSHFHHRWLSCTIYLHIWRWFEKWKCVSSILRRSSLFLPMTFNCEILLCFIGGVSHFDDAFDLGDLWGSTTSTRVASCCCFLCLFNMRSSFGFLAIVSEGKTTLWPLTVRSHPSTEMHAWRPLWGSPVLRSTTLMLSVRSPKSLFEGTVRLWKQTGAVVC